MMTPVEKRNSNKFCEFHGEVEHNTDECMHLKRQIEVLLKSGKLSHVIKEIKQNSGKDQHKVNKKGEASGKDKALAILMIQPWQRVARQRITQSFSPCLEISFPPIDEEESVERPMIIEVEVGGHFIHRMYVDGISFGNIIEHQLYFDVTYGCNHISIQWNYWKARNKKDTSSPVNCSRNAKIPWPIGYAYPDINQDEEEEIKRMAINPEYLEQTIMIGSTLSEEGCPPIRQKKRGQAADRNQAIQEEVGKLVGAGIMKEVHYHIWLSNPVMVKKHDGSWRMFVDFKDLNKTCPKDSYPLPEIDWKKKSLLVHQTLKRCTKKSDFCWTDEAESAFRQMKQHIAKLPMLTAPEEKEELIVYLAAARETVSAVLMTEREAKQMPIYFVSRALRGPEVNYTSMEKLVLVLVHASKRLRRYFQAHPIIMITDQPIKQVLSKPEVAGRLQKWSIELGEYAIHYRPRISVKGQILADFIVERPEEDAIMEIQEELPEPWVLFTDGSSCADGSGAGLILTSPEGMEFTYALRFGFEATNNEAEYEALITGSPRSENKKADAFSKIASTSFSHLSKQVLVEELKEKSINEVEVLAVVEEEEETWMTPIHEYLAEGYLPQKQ
ncbi:reverse transcriptase domain-containing protein [Tanacetum coccineum]